MFKTKIKITREAIANVPQRVFINVKDAIEYCAEKGISIIHKEIINGQAFYIV